MTVMRTGLINKKRTAVLVFCSLVFIAGLCKSGIVASVGSARPSAGTEPTLTYRALFDIDTLTISLPFVHDSLCFVTDPANSLSNFTKELIDLRCGKDTVINVVHLGDSHIQAGHLSGRTMRLLQGAFGNAGRGWIAPFKLSRVNEPPDYYILSNVKDWIAGRCIQVNPKCPWGIGGIGIQTAARDIDFRLIIAPKNGYGYSFNKVLLYRDCKAAPMSPAVMDEELPTLMSLGEQPYDNLMVDTFTTACLVDTFVVRSIREQNQSKSNLYYGFMLMNGNPGVLYHSIGVNGAKYTDYTNREYVRQLSLLKPSLLIVSLGTNESFGRNFNKESFEQQLDLFVRLVREEMPQTTLLISTPAETYKRIYKNKKAQYLRNENIAKIADVISSYTVKEGIACWDLYTITDGDNSCKKWFDAQMLGRDRVHFSRVGYEEQGNLLYKSLVRTCIGGDLDVVLDLGHTDDADETDDTDEEVMEMEGEESYVE